MTGTVKGPTADEFRKALQGNFAEAERRGASQIEVTSGDLHREVGGYPARSHRMRECCRIMREAMHAETDSVRSEPDSGQGASLTIRYKLPR